MRGKRDFEYTCRSLLIGNQTRCLKGSWTRRRTNNFSSLNLLSIHLHTYLYANNGMEWNKGWKMQQVEKFYWLKLLKRIKIRNTTERINIVSSKPADGTIKKIERPIYNSREILKRWRAKEQRARGRGRRSKPQTRKNFPHKDLHSTSFLNAK